MKKYKVLFDQTQMYTFTDIEAENEEEAKAKAIEQMNDGYGNPSDSEITNTEITEIKPKNNLEAAKLKIKKIQNE